MKDLFEKINLPRTIGVILLILASVNMVEDYLTTIGALDIISNRYGLRTSVTAFFDHSLTLTILLGAVGLGLYAESVEQGSVQYSLSRIAQFSLYFLDGCFDFVTIVGISNNNKIIIQASTGPSIRLLIAILVGACIVLVAASVISVIAKLKDVLPMAGLGTTSVFNFVTMLLGVLAGLATWLITLPWITEFVVGLYGYPAGTTFDLLPENLAAGAVLIAAFRSFILMTFISDYLAQFALILLFGDGAKLDGFRGKRKNAKNQRESGQQSRNQSNRPPRNSNQGSREAQRSRSNGRQSVPSVRATRSGDSPAELRF